MLESVYQQSSMLRFEFKQKIKWNFNNFDKQVENLMKSLKSTIKGDTAAEDYFETMSILYLEILREFDNCKDPKVAFALFQAINQGMEVKVDGKTIPTSEPEYLVPQK